MAVQLDEVDIQLLSALQEDADRTNVELARLTGLSPAATLHRVRRLKESGVIRVIRAEVDPAAAGFPLQVYVTATLTRHDPRSSRVFDDLIRSLPQIIMADNVAGETDYFLSVVARDVAELQTVLAALATRGGQRLVTYLRLAEIKPPSRLPLAPVSAPARRRGARRTRDRRSGNETAVTRVQGGMRIAVIGKGNIGGSLGSKWRAAGHDVVYGARDGSGEGPGGAPVRGIGDALKDADVVVLAVPGQVVADVVTEHGAALAGKTVIDAVNRIGAPEFDSRAIIADAAPQARYVRAFNSLGWENFADPMPGTNMFFAADPDARATAEELIRAVGLEPAFLGDATATTTVDGLLPLWFALVQQNGGNRRVALRIITEG